MTAAKKPRRNNESNRREGLLRVSARLFGEKGFDGTSKQAGHMPGDAQLMRLLILGAVHWTGAWYGPGGRLSFDDIAEGAARLFLRRTRT